MLSEPDTDRSRHTAAVTRVSAQQVPSCQTRTEDLVERGRRRKREDEWYFKSEWMITLVCPLLSSQSFHSVAARSVAQILDTSFIIVKPRDAGSILIRF